MAKYSHSASKGLLYLILAPFSIKILCPASKSYSFIIYFELFFPSDDEGKFIKFWSLMRFTPTSWCYHMCDRYIRILGRISPMFLN
jgi:hypothetical protein